MADVVWNPKEPGETVLYSVDWTEIAPDTIDSFTITRSTGTVVIGDTDNDDTTVTALISGGVNAETATLTNTITTSLGQILVKTISLKVAADADVLSPISTITKGAIVIRALGKLGIANYVFDTEAEEDVSALRQLDSLAASWQGKLRPFGYLQPATNGASLPSDDAGIDEADVDAFIYGLAEVLAPDYGKNLSGPIMKRAADERSAFLCRYQVQAEYAMPRRQPVGAGNDRSYRRFF
jgi:hypothetical protein